MSNKEKKIRVFNIRKWALYIFIITFIVGFIVLLIDNSTITLVGVFLIIVFWIFLAKFCYEYVSINEYKKIRSYKTDLSITKELTKQGFSKAEIAKILKDRPVSDYEDYHALLK